MSSSAKVYVVRYKPTDSRDPDHWGLYIAGAGGGDTSIHQIIDKFENGRYRVASPRYNTNPEKARLFKEKVLVGNIPGSVLTRARDLIQSQPVDNRSSTWNCQSWVLEALKALEAKNYVRLRSEDTQHLRSERQRWQ